MGLAERRKAMGYSQEGFAHALGVDRTTIGRWDRGETKPGAVHRPKMAELLRLDIAELDVLLTPLPVESQESAGSPCGDRHGSGEHEDMIRREFLRLVAVTGVCASLSPDEAEADADGAEHGSIDGFRRMNGHLWQVYQLARAKDSVTQVVQEQLRALNDALKKASPRHSEALCEAAGDLFQLAGELAFDGDRYTHAAAAYTAAASAGRNVRAFDLWACALVRHAYVDLYEKRFAEAVEVLDAAREVAARGDSSLSTRYWVASVQAEAYAGLRDFDSCERALDETQRVTDLSGLVHNEGWLRFDGSRLAEERGARYVQLGRLELAESTLKSVLDSDALSTGASFRRRGAVLADLAAIGAKRRDVEQVVTHAAEALRLARQTGSGYIARRLRGLQVDLAPLSRDSRVAELGAEIGVLRTT